MLDEVIKYLKEHFNQEDIQIILLLAEGAGLMRDLHKMYIKKGIRFTKEFDEYYQKKLDEMVVYLDKVMEDLAP